MIKYLTMMTLVFSLNVSAGLSCERIGEIGGNFMKKRQEGVEISTMMHPFDEKWVTKVILSAYKIPIQQSKSSKNKVVSIFSDRLVKLCYLGLI